MSRKKTKFDSVYLYNDDLLRFEMGAYGKSGNTSRPMVSGNPSIIFIF
jgi:hypothetical protein